MSGNCSPHVFSYSAICSCVLGTNSPPRGSHLMEQRLSFFVKRHHVSLSRDPLALCWAAGLLRQSCTPSTALTTPAWSALQLSRSSFEHPLWYALPRPHGVPHRGHGVRTQQTTCRGWAGGGGKTKHTQVTLYVPETEPNCYMTIRGHVFIFPAPISDLSNQHFVVMILRPCRKWVFSL